MWQRIVLTMLARLARRGRLTAMMPDGSVHVFGDPATGPDVTLKLTDPARLRGLVRDPELAMGEAYMDGTFTIEKGDLRQMFTLFALNGGRRIMPPAIAAGYRARFLARRWMQANDPRRARANVAHHYDLGDDFYALFLDADRQYSCAYFPRPGMSLEEAQAAKKAHIAKKLLIAPGMRVLDIGCGWGGLAITLARDHGARVTGVTLSENQHRAATARVAAAGLATQVDIRLMDYRDLRERFDRVVSVGMLEHVGVPNYGTYFARVAELMGPDGVALVHCIGRCGPPTTTSGWLAKYIFPGGYNPSLSELMPAIEATGLWQGDIEVWRGHYAETLRHWQARFEANVEQVRAMYDERFVRMWRYYLAGAEVSFDAYGHVVYQIQLAKRRDTVPNTRDYLYGPPALPSDAAPSRRIDGDGAQAAPQGTAPVAAFSPQR